MNFISSSLSWSNFLSHSKFREQFGDAKSSSWTASFTMSSCSTVYNPIHKCYSCSRHTRPCSE